MTTAFPIRGLFGCEPEKLSTNVLTIRPGVISEYYGYDSLEFLTSNQINLATNGLWGLDTGTITSGDEVYIYAIKNYTTGDYGLIASRSRFMGGIVYPSGYQFVRKLPFGFIYNTFWDGIPNYHLSHWPQPNIRFTDAEYSSLWMPVFGGSATTWTNINLGDWVPDNARVAYILSQVRYNSGTAGSGYIRTYSGQTTGLLVGSASPGSPFPGQTFTPIRVDSLRRMQYKVTGNVQMYIQVLGYDMTEPS